MAEFTIDGATYETDNLVILRVIALYQKALSEEAESAAVEVKNLRIELGRKLKELVIDKKDDKSNSKKK